MNMQEIYEAVARRYGISAEEVKEEMERAVSAAYTGDRDGVAQELQQKVPRKGEIPTSKELIQYLARQLDRS